MYTSIVVPLDGSPFGRRALSVALALARRSDAALHLVHVHEPVVFPGNAPMWDARLDNETRENMRTDLTDVAARITRETSLSVNATFLDGPIVPTMQRYLADLRPGLVVMTTHGRGGLSRMWLGSVADGLVRHVAVPVLLVRAEAEGANEPVEPLFRRILVPLDGSATAEEVLDHVVSLATPDATVYTLLTVVVPVPSMPLVEYPYPDYAGLSDGTEIRSRQATALEHLERSAEELRESGASVETRVLVHYQPAQGILDAAEEWHADLIAVSTHGRGGVKRALLGSVADKVMRGATATVLVRRPESTRANSERADRSDVAPMVPRPAMLP